MLDYFVKVLLFQTLFLAVYDIVLKKETFFQCNRAYLLITSVVAYALPFVKIQQVAEVVSQEYMVLLPEVVLSPQTVLKEQFDWSIFLFTALKWLFLAGVLVAFVLFIVRLVQLLRTIKTHQKDKKPTYSLVYVNSKAAFSFFNYIFLGSQISKENKQQIIAHELVHVEQKHSLDLLFFELQKIVFWFNPFSYIYQNRISELHEFIADSKSIKETDKVGYFQHMLAEAFGTQKISFINHFFKHSLIKKRIVMLNKAKSKQLSKFKYVLMVPLLAGMLIYSSCEKQGETVIKDKSMQELISELEAKSADKKLTKEELSSLMKLIEANIPTDAPEARKRFVVEQLYSLILEKKGVLEGATRKFLEVDAIKGDDVPFAIVDNVPVFPGCEGKDPKACLNRGIQEFVAKEFNADIAQTLGLSPGKKKIYVQFKITKTGDVEILGARAPHKDLEAEARRVVNLLPKMTPGKQNGKDVNVTYMLPIAFNIN